MNGFMIYRNRGSVLSTNIFNFTVGRIWLCSESSKSWTFEDKPINFGVYKVSTTRGKCWIVATRWVMFTVGLLYQTERVEI